MKWKCNLFIIALFAPMAAAAQIKGLQSDKLSLSYDQTLHLIYRSNIKYFDIGNKKYVTIDKPEDLTNIVRLKANEKNFPGETNVTVVTNDGNYHSYILTYNGHPEYTYVSELKPYTDPDRIQVSDTKSTHLIFPQHVKYIDYGNNTIEANSTVVDNIVKLQAAEKHFPETNVSVVTTDNQFYTLNITYGAEPAQLTYLIDSKDIHTTNKNVALFKEEELKSNERDSLCARMYKKGRYIQHLAAKKSGVTLIIPNIFIYNKTLFVKMELRNASSIRYDIDFIKFYVQDKKTTKQTASQEVSIEPLFLDNFQKTIEADKRNSYIAAFEKFTIPDDKNLIIEIQEQNGGRNFRYKVEDKDIMEAQNIY